jgi:DNA repair exonuclease SbcCD ATPase subunit
MKVGTVLVGNMLAIGYAEFKLNDQGLLALMGVNLDDSSASSNGAAKSSLMEAVNWCLWDTTAKGASGDDIIRGFGKLKGMQANVIVTLIDDDDKTTFTISRTRKPGKTTLTLSKSEPDPADPAAPRKITSLTGGTNKITQETIQKIIGCTEDVFRAAVYIGQESIPDLPRMTDKMLKVMIEEAAGVTILEAAYKRALVLQFAQDKEAAACRQTVDRLESNLEVLKQSVLTEIDRKRVFEEDRERALTDLAAEITKTADAKRAVMEEWLKLPDRSAIEGGLALIDKRIAGFSSELDEEKRLLALHSRAQAKRAGLDSSLRLRADRVTELDKEVANVESLVGTTCKTCGSMLSAGHLCDAKRLAEESLEHSKATFFKVKGDLLAAITEEKACWEAIEAYRPTMHDPSDLNLKRAKLQKVLDEHNHYDASVRRLSDAWERLEKETVTIRHKTNPHTAMVEDLKKIVEKAKETLALAISAASEAGLKLGHIAAAATVFSPKGVRAHILDTVTPYLNAQTAGYLSVLSDGAIQATWSTLTADAKGELKERFAIDVQHVNGGTSFASLSGGERRKVRVACALALQDLVASRATKPINLWVADEIDTALDKAGLERLMMVLQEKAKERGTVVVISHSDLSDWISNVWTVTKSKDVASLSPC